MTPTIAILVAGLYMPLAALPDATFLNTDDPVTASFVREFERAAGAAHLPSRESASEGDRLPEIFRAALTPIETNRPLQLALETRN